MTKTLIAVLGIDRAGTDVWATTCLLASNANDSRSIAAHMIDAARRDTWRLYADRAPFDCKEVLKVAGYRWAPIRRAWWVEGNSEQIANEETWLRQLSSEIVPSMDRVTWMSRFV